MPSSGSQHDPQLTPCCSNTCPGSLQPSDQNPSYLACICRPEPSPPASPHSHLPHPCTFTSCSLRLPWSFLHPSCETLAGPSQVPSRHRSPLPHPSQWMWSCPQVACRLASDLSCCMFNGRDAKGQGVGSLSFIHSPFLQLSICAHTDYLHPLVIHLFIYPPTQSSINLPMYAPFISYILSSIHSPVAHPYISLCMHTCMISSICPATLPPTHPFIRHLVCPPSHPFLLIHP